MSKQGLKLSNAAIHFGYLWFGKDNNNKWKLELIKEPS